MANIGTLAVKLTAKTGEFVGGMSKAAATTKKMTATVSTMATVTAKTLAGMATAVAGTVAAMGKLGADSITELGKTSRALDASAEGFASLEFAAKSFGGTGDDVKAGLGAMNSSLGRAAVGGVAAGQAFRRLGLSAGELVKLKTDQAFARVAGSIARIADPAQRAAAAVGVFGTSTGGLLPLLTQGEGGLARFAREAERLGLTMSDSQAAGVQSAFAFNQIKATLEGISRSIAVGLAPLLTAAQERFAKLGITGKDVAGAVTAGVKMIAKGVAHLVDAWGWVHKALLRVSAATEDFLSSFANGIATLTGSEGARKFADDVAANTSRIREEIGRLDQGGSAAAGVDRFFASLTKAHKRHAAKFLKDATGGGMNSFLAKFNEQLQQVSGSITGSALTPLQSLHETLGKVNFAFEHGAISAETFARSSANALAQLEKAHGIQSIQLAGAVRGGTSAAYSATVRSTREGDMRLRENPQQRVERVLQESKEIEKKQLEQQRKIAEALQKAATKEVMIG